MAATAAARAPRPRARARPRPRPRARPRRKAAAGRRVAGGAVWIVLMGLLLAGVVALNVAVLRLNLGLDGLTQERAQLRAENAELSSKLAALAASARTASLARREGLVKADPAETTYLQLGER
jgi:cell division protein FtsB